MCRMRLRRLFNCTNTAFSASLYRNVVKERNLFLQKVAYGNSHKCDSDSMEKRLPPVCSGNLLRRRRHSQEKVTHE